MKQYNKPIYFITICTYEKYPYFNEDVLSQILIDEIELCKKIKSFLLYAYKINLEHIHLLIKPTGDDNISEIMRSLKTNYSRNINKILNQNNDYVHTIINCKNKKLQFYKEQLLHKNDNLIVIPKFKWQKSFHDHIIRDEIDFYNHIKYIENQWIKHGYNKNKWCFIDFNLIHKLK